MGFQAPFHVIHCRLYFCVLGDALRTHEFHAFFFTDTATTEIYTLSLHDALPISWRRDNRPAAARYRGSSCIGRQRSEEHTSELQSRRDLVCRLLLEKKNKTPHCFPIKL